MKLVARKSAARERCDRLEFIRNDGTSTAAHMSRVGVLPHELVHYVVEIGFGFRRGYLGRVARGAAACCSPEAVHDPASGALDREAVVAEAIVAALHAQLRDETFDFDAFAEDVRTACATHDVAPPCLSAAASRAVYEAAVNLNAQWAKVPPDGEFELQFAGIKC